MYKYVMPYVGKVTIFHHFPSMVKPKLVIHGPPGGQVLVVALSPMLLGAPEWRQHMVQLSGCVAYMLQKDRIG